jgi:hypothetical protein
VTCTAAHGLYVTGNNEPYGIVIAGVTDASFNGTFPINQVTSTTQLTYNQTAANGSSSSGTVSALWGYSHGVTGSTTYNYKFVSIDQNLGFSAASANLAITTGNATLGVFDYNWMNIPAVLNSREVAVYSDKGLGGALTCIGVTFTNGYSDYGLAPLCPAGLPVNPPVAAGAQLLNTTIVSGGGTTTLTLAATASNTATTQGVYHDESSFLNSCVTDLNTDIGGGNAGSSNECFFPTGFYGINGNLVTDTLTTNVGLLKIAVAGTLNFQVMPWYISHGVVDIEGVGSGGGTASFSHNPTVRLVFNNLQVSAGFVLRKGATNVKIKGFSMSSLGGSGIWMGSTWDAGGTISGVHLEDLLIGLATNGNGAPIWMDGGTLGVWGDHLVLSGQQNGLSVVMMPVSAYNATDSCCIYLDNISSVWHGIRVDYPAGNLTGGKTGSIFIKNWLSEDLVSTDNGFILNDSGPNAPGSGASGINGIVIENVNNADALGGPSADGLIGELGTSAATITSAGVSAINAGGFGSYVKCRLSSTLCNAFPAASGFNLNGDQGGVWGGGLSTGGSWDQGFLSPAPVVNVGVPLASTLQISQYQANPSSPAYVMMMPPLGSLLVTGTGAGSLAAGTYFMRIVGVDSQPVPGLTVPSNEVSSTVGASSSITVSFNIAAAAGNMYNSLRLYYGTSGAGSETCYFVLPSVASPFTFTTTAGATCSVNVQHYPSAYLTWLGNDATLVNGNFGNVAGAGCIYCNFAGSGTNIWQLGVGDPQPPSSVKFSVKGGAVNSATSGYWAIETAAPTGVANSDQLWGDSTAHRWKMNNNNVGADSVVGAATTDTLVNKTLSSAVILNPNLLWSIVNPSFTSGFNSGSLTTSNGPPSFLINIGTGTAGSTGVIGLPTATNGWNCFVTNQTRAAVIQATTVSASSVTFTNFGTTFTATNWTNSDVLQASCFGR